METMSAPDEPKIDSYAPPARQRGYIKAMQQITAARRPGQPVRIYYSAPPLLMNRDNWQRRLDLLQELLPAGVELLHYRKSFDPEQDYYEQWEKIAATLDGLIVTGRRPHKKRHQKHVQDLGPIARRELISVVGAGKPVLLYSMDLGLVPVVDCEPRRRGVEPEQRLKLRIPAGWQRDSPTLEAALDALRPAVDFGKDATVGPPHLEKPFVPPPQR